MSIRAICKCFKANQPFTAQEREQLEFAFGREYPDRIQTIYGLLREAIHFEDSDGISPASLIRLIDEDTPGLGYREALIFGVWRGDVFFLGGIRPVLSRMNPELHCLDFIDRDD